MSNTNAQLEAVTFDDLPVNVVELIFSYLTFRDVTKLQQISSYVYNLCVRYIQRSLNKLRKTIYTSMKKLCNEINFAKFSTTLEIRNCLKVYNVLESVEESLEMITVLNRHSIERGAVCLPIAEVLDEYFEIIGEISTDLTKVDKIQMINIKMQKNLSSVMDNMENSIVKLKDVIPLGVRAIDLLDLIKNISYKVIATYNIKDNMCSLSLKYYLENPKLLSYLPIIPYVKDCRKRLLSFDEQDAIMKYLVMLVNVHNKLEAKTEQYKRELEVSRREFMGENNGLIESALCSQPKNLKIRECNKREILDNATGKIQEVYKNFDKFPSTNQGVTCTVKLKCQISEAPLQIKNSYESLKQDIQLEEPSVIAINPKIFEDIVPSIDMYSFNFRLRVCIPAKIPEIFEINFQDGNF